VRPPFWRRVPGSWSYVLRIFARRPEDDVDAELRFHFDERIAALTHEGSSPEAARRQALEEFGDIDAVRTSLRAIDHRAAERRRRADWWEQVARDIRIALRGFRRTPAFAGTVVLILALGIGMAVAMFTVFDAVLLRTLPVRDQNEVVVVTPNRDAGVEFPVDLGDVERFRSESRTLRDVAGVAHYGTMEVPLTDGGRSLALAQSRVTGNYFQLLGAHPALGRLLRPEDDVVGAAPVIVLSFHAWRREFAGDTSILGHHLLEPGSQSAYTIVGVGPPGFDYPVGADYWTAIVPTGYPSVDIVARLAPQISLAAARTEFLAFVRRVEPEQRYSGAEIRTLEQTILGDVRPVLTILLAAVALLLLIACVNVGNLLLLRGASRARELAVRRALGASVADVTRQLLVESGLLGAAGGVAGLFAANMLLRLLLALAPTHLPRIEAIGLSGASVGVAIGITVLATLLFGVAPAFQAVRSGLTTSLRGDARSGTETRRRRYVRQYLVAGQMAMALVMLSGAGLLIHSLERMQTVDLGFTPKRLSVITLSFPWARYGTLPEASAFLEDVVPRMRAVAGVEAVSPILIPPFIGVNVWMWKFQVEGEPREDVERMPLIPIETGGEGLFQALGLPIVRGRGFRSTDRAGSEDVVVVSESVAQRYWPREDAIGKRIRVPQLPDSAWRTVVGVVEDTHFRSLRSASPAIYLPWRQSTTQYVFFAVRTISDLGAVVPALQHAIHDLDSSVLVWRAESMTDLLGAPLAQPRTSAFLLASFALAALLLTAVGLYGTLASVVREQTRGIGIRMALGASPERVRREILRDALNVTAAGAFIGIIVALASSKLYASLLFDVRPEDPVAILSACTILILVALVAAYVPARRATRIDPARALREE
jgi:putative ABC transport system permease protein